MVVNNPNNWHWVDKNCIDWSRQYFDDKTVGLSVEDGYKVTISSVSSVEGDVEVCQRKGKVISLFDLKLTFSLNIDPEEGDKSYEGSIIVPELAYDSDEDSLQFDVSIYDAFKGDDKVRSGIKRLLIPKLRQLLLKFGPDLITTHSSDIQLDSEKVNSKFTKENQTTAKAAPVAKKEVAAPQKTTTVTAAPVKASSSSSVPKYNTSTLHLEPEFNTTAEQLYITLLDGSRIVAWTRSPPEIDSFPPKEGSSFSLFGGSIQGRFLKLVKNERIVQLWRLSDWKEGHYAELDIQLVQGAGETKMVVKWSGIPIGEEDRVRGNFEDYYIRSIKITFGFGAVL